MTWYSVALLLVAIVSGATASIVGFGIGSLLTPLLAARFGTGVAVAAVTLPHAAATAFRCWRLRTSIDRQVLVRFGVLSAAGALAGALLYTRLGGTALTGILGGLLARGAKPLDALLWSVWLHGEAGASLAVSATGVSGEGAASSG